MCKVSIVIPAYNASKTIERCIRSIFKQDYQDYEIIVVNDGSKDDTGEILDRLAQEDNRLKVIHKKNGGYQVLETWLSNISQESMSNLWMPTI